MGKLSGRHAVITGAGRGIGFSIAKKLLAMQAKISIFDIDENLVIEACGLTGKAGVEVFGAVCDVANPESVNNAMAKARDHHGLIDILINNAGIIFFNSLEDTSLQQYQNTMDVNVLGPFLCTQIVVPDMKKQKWGKIVTVGSSAGKTGGAGKAGVYGASKAAVMTLMKSYARELAPFNINVNGVAPALIDTQMLAGITGFIDQIPLGRVGTPEDVANAVAFLCSENASFIIGEMMDVNGGFLID